MEITKENLKVALKNIIEARNSHGEISVSRPIVELLLLMGLDPEILQNPNQNVIPDEVYATIEALSNNADINIINQEHVVSLKTNHGSFQRVGHNNHTAVVELKVVNGNLKLQVFHKNHEGIPVLRSVEIATGEYSNGKHVVRTLEGNYRVSPLDTNFKRGTSYYNIHEYNSDGIEGGLRMVELSNKIPIQSMLSSTFDGLKEMDGMMRQIGILHGISADMQANQQLLFDKKSYVDKEVIYYRGDDLSRVVSSVRDKDGNTKSGLVFTYYNQYGVDNLGYHAEPARSELLTEEEFQTQLDAFYSDPSNLERLKAKSSQAACDKIDAAYQGYMEKQMKSGYKVM